LRGVSGLTACSSCQVHPQTRAWFPVMIWDRLPSNPYSSKIGVSSPLVPVAALIASEMLVAMIRLGVDDFAGLAGYLASGYGGARDTDGGTGPFGEL